jgi:hypothetical protein
MLSMCAWVHRHVLFVCVWCVCVRVCVCVRACVRARVRARVSARARARARTHVHVHVRSCTCAFACALVHMRFWHVCNTGMPCAPVTPMIMHAYGCSGVLHASRECTCVVAFVCESSCLPADAQTCA